MNVRVPFKFLVINFIVYDRVSCSQGWSHYLVKDKLELLILVPLLPECSDYMCTP